MKALIIASIFAGFLIGAFASLQGGASLPVSAHSGQWQIQDWYGHPDASREELDAYRMARRQYPRKIVIRPFWRALVDDKTNCTWRQHIARWPVVTGPTDVWLTAIYCPGLKSKIEAWTIPSNINNDAGRLADWFRYYAELNSHAIEVMFDSGQGATYIDYIPADWARSKSAVASN